MYLGVKYSQIQASLLRWIIKSGAPAFFLELSHEHSLSFLNGQWACAFLKSNPWTLCLSQIATAPLKSSGPHHPLPSHCEVGK